MAIDSLIDWASKLPDWQQDALRRIAQSTELTGADNSEILANLKISKGLQQQDELNLQPISRDHVQSDATMAPLIHLCSIDNVKNTNKLAPDQVLTFGTDGITLIYGSNGSGKSGYCRILKKVCRTIVKDTIYPDVFEEITPAVAQARIRYRRQGETDVSSVIWRDGEECVRDIAHLSVFDSNNARLYLDERNRIDYLPYEIELLTRFGQLLTRLKDDLSTEMDIVDGRLKVGVPTNYATGTKVFELVERLTTQTELATLPTAAEIESLGSWTDKLSCELENLQQAIGSDPRILAERCRRIQSVLSTLVDRLEKARDALSVSKARELEQSVAHARTRTKAAELAANTLFKDEPLPFVGSDPWQLMFRHAKEYSKLAYPDVKPPATGEGDLCVLCHQPLLEDAAERLRRFERYVAGEAKTNAVSAVASRDSKSDMIKKIQIPSPDDAASLLSEFASLSDARAETAAEVKKFVQRVHNRRSELLAAVETGNFTQVVPLDCAEIDKLVAEKHALGEEAEAHERNEHGNSECEEHRRRLAELIDRKHFSECLESFQDRRNDLESRAKLQECVDATNTTVVSLQVNAFRKELVTEDLKGKICTEIDIFGLGHIPFLIKDVSRKGESEFDLKLNAKIKVASRDVLSEGEQRALGLACFLADVNRQPAKHGIVVDDPVSSLDQDRMRRVATRLVEEAASGRQVIIFTHNLLFFSEVMSSAAAQNPSPVPVHTNVIRKVEGLGFGVVSDSDQPWEATPTTKRINLLQAKVEMLDTMTDKDGDAYRDEVKNFYTELRETWERLVEEVLLCNVVKRFDSDVKTQSLKGVVVDNEDYRVIFWAMKRASERSGHDMAAGRNMPLPTTKEMKDQVNELDRYRTKVRKRANETERERKKLERPPKGRTV